MLSGAGSSQSLLGIAWDYAVSLARAVFIALLTGWTVVLSGIADFVAEFSETSEPFDTALIGIVAAFTFFLSRFGDAFSTQEGGTGEDALLICRAVVVVISLAVVAGFDTF